MIFGPTIANAIKVFTPATVAFFIGIIISPILTHYLFKYKAWKKAPGKQALDGSKAEVFEKLRVGVETKTPRMGGIVIWGSVFITTVGIWALSVLLPSAPTTKLDFLSRSQTWIPLFTLMVGGIVGLVNDILDVRSDKGERGIPLVMRLIIVGLVSAFIGWWFYGKLDIVSIAIPFGTDLYLGVLIIPFFVAVSVLLYASGIIDGIDGLSGGIFAMIFASYGIIAFSQSQIDLAAFAFVVTGALLAFLWFNIPPARFWMTETGTMGLTMTIAVLAFMTDTLGDGEGIIVLPIIGFLLVVTVASNVIQVLSKKFLGKKVFKIAPLHHHFEALGWPGYKVTMRYWILAVIVGFIGILVALVSP